MSVLRVLVPEDLSRLTRDGRNRQEHGLRLLFCVHLAVHEFGSRRTWHDVHDRAWERYCEFLSLAIDPVCQWVESVAAKRETSEPNLCDDDGGGFPIGLSGDQASRRSHRERGDRAAVCRYGENMGLPRRRLTTSVVRHSSFLDLSSSLGFMPGVVT
jgi:hypothetical protein